MKKVKAVLLHPITISIFGITLLSLLVWFFGPHIKFGADNVAPLGEPTVRLLIIMAILVLWGLNNLRIQAKARKNNQELVDDIRQSQDDVGRDHTSDQAAEEVAQINERFVDALNTLRKLRFKGRANRKSKALYELPWYIIVGPPGAGKTTALVNSGLEFPLADQFGKAALQGIGGTRNCDWWFTNDAVLVDTAGRYTTQDSHRVVDSSAWEGFLDLLKRHRRRRPINGVIVSISLQDLLTQTEEERFQHAKTIRTRIDELMAKLEVRFPVYLMFTKSDLVSGFNEFFEDLSKEEREQVWGTTLPDAPEADATPDVAFLATELQQLEQRLYDRVLWRMHQERDVNRRAAIERFPKQMEQVNALVKEFVQQAFSPNRYHYQPYLRGVYFSSGTQDGTPIDRLMSSVSSSFGFSREASQSPSQRGKSFFLGRLFQDVIIPESELVGTNRRYERLQIWGRRTCYGALAGVSVVLLLVWAGAVSRHALFMEDVKTHLATFENERRELASWDRSPRAVLPSLTALAQASEVYNQEAHPWLTGVGLYDGRIDRRADDAYHAYLRADFLTALLEYTEAALQRAEDSIELYNTFRVYRMFEQVDRLDTPRVAEWFQNQWSYDAALQTSEQQQLARHLNRLLSLKPEPRELNEAQVRAVAQRLLQLPVAQRVYNRIQNDRQYQRSVDMTLLFGNNAGSVFEVDDRARQAANVPWLYTHEGFKEIDVSSNSSVLRELVDDRWIFDGSGYTDTAMENPDLPQISKQVTDYYLTDYARTWSQLLNSIQVRPFSNMQQAADVLSRAADPLSSPIRRILQLGAQHTQLTDTRATDAIEGRVRGNVGRAVDYMASRREGNLVDQRFADLHRLMQATDDSPAAIESTLEEVRKLSQYVQEINMAPDPNQRAFDIAKARFTAGAGNQMTSLRAYARDMPAPLDSWLNGLADETWRVIMRGAHAHINREWQGQVYRAYTRTASGRYPLTADSDSEMSVFEFGEFFKPGGIYQGFFNEYIEPFVNARGTWGNRAVDGYSIGFSRSALEQLQHGLSITELFFQGGTESPRMSLDLQPHDMDQQVARFTLDMGSERITYNHGPKFWGTVDWTGAGAGNRLRLAFEDLNGSTHNRSYRGPWSWFRALEDAQVQPTSRSNVYLVTFTPDSQRHKISYEVRAQTANNLFNRNPLRLFRIPEAL